LTDDTRPAPAWLSEHWRAEVSSADADAWVMFCLAGDEGGAGPSFIEGEFTHAGSDVPTDTERSVAMAAAPDMARALAELSAMAVPVPYGSGFVVPGPVIERCRVALLLALGRELEAYMPEVDERTEGERNPE